MEIVTKERFFEALKAANKQGLDPMPSKLSNHWECQKTRRLFGRIEIQTVPPNRYYLAGDQP